MQKIETQATLDTHALALKGCFCAYAISTPISFTGLFVHVDNTSVVSSKMLNRTFRRSNTIICSIHYCLLGFRKSSTYLN